MPSKLLRKLDDTIASKNKEIEALKKRESELLNTIDICRGALADIATAKDLDETVMRKKAQRIYNETAIKD